MSKITDVRWTINQYYPLLEFNVDGKSVKVSLDQKKTLVDLDIFSVWAPEIELPMIHLNANDNMGAQDLEGFIQSETLGKLLKQMADACTDGSFSEREIEGEFEL